MSFSITRRAAAQALSASRAFSTSVARPVARITIVGHLGDTPEVQVTSTGHEVVKYAVATNSGPKDNRKTSWFRIASFEPDGPRRELLRNLPKGSMVFVEGDATVSTYQDADGKNASSLNIIQRNIEVLKRPQTDAPVEA